MEEEKNTDFSYQFPEDFEYDEERGKSLKFNSRIRIIILIIILLYFIVLIVGSLYLGIKKVENYENIITSMYFFTLYLVIFIIVFKYLFYINISNNRRFLIFLRSDYPYQITGDLRYFGRTRRSIVTDYNYKIRHKKSGFVDEFNDNNKNIFKMIYTSYEYNTDFLIKNKFYAYFHFKGRKVQEFNDIFADEDNGINFGALFEFEDGECVKFKYTIKLKKKHGQDLHVANLEVLESSVIGDDLYEHLMDLVDITNDVMHDVCESLFKEYSNSLYFKFDPFNVKRFFE